MRFVLLIALITAACSATTKLTEVRPVPTLASYDRAAVTVRAQNAALESASEQVEICRAEIPAALLEGQVFTRVAGADAPLLIDVTVVETEELSGDGDAQVIVRLRVDIRDAAKPEPIGELELLGSSADADSHRYRAACGHAARALAKYLGKRR